MLKNNTYHMMKRINLLLLFISLSSIISVAEIKKVTIDEPQNWTVEQLSQYVGDTVQFETPFYVVNNYFMLSGKLSVSPRRIMTPTNQVLPASTSYSTMVSNNTNGHVYLAISAGSYRTGQQIKNLTVKVESKTNFRAIGTQTFYGNERKTTHDNIGDYTLKVCGFNLEIYIASDYDYRYGPANETEAAAQHEKIIKALQAIDADIYGFAEIQQGQGALKKIVDALNKNVSADKHYAYVDDGGSVSGTWTKVAFIYRKNKVEPYKSLLSDNTGVRNRKKIQAFRQLSNGEIFVYSINHFKAKSGSGSGANADKGDGQGAYNADRVAEAEAVLELLDEKASYWADTDVLLMGDLNAYAMEDPIQTFINNDFIDLNRAFHADSAYSYTYYNSKTKISEAGYLDHALASSTLKKQVTGVTTFHINSDENDKYSYSGSMNDGSMYRSSDHDPVIVGLALGNYSASAEIPLTDRVQLNMNEYLSGKELLTIKNAQKTNLCIYTPSGVMLFQDKINTASYIVNTANFPQGIYIMNIFGEKIMKQVKFIVR